VLHAARAVLQQQPCALTAVLGPNRRPESGKPEMLGLSAYPHAAWQAYNLALAAHPIFTKCMTSLTCFILSDTVAQLPSGKVPYSPPRPPMPGPRARCLPQQGSAAEHARAPRSLTPCGLRALRRLAFWCTHPPAMCGTTSWTTMSTPASRPGATLGPPIDRYLLNSFLFAEAWRVCNMGLALSQP